MTEGELQASKIEEQAKRIKLFALPLAVCASIANFFLIVPKVSFSLLVFVLLIIVAFDDYRKLNKIIKSPAKLNELKSIETKRKAAVFVNGGFAHEMKHILLITVAVIAWLLKLARSMAKLFSRFCQIAKLIAEPITIKMSNSSGELLVIFIMSVVHREVLVWERDTSTLPC